MHFQKLLRLGSRIHSSTRTPCKYKRYYHIFSYLALFLPFSMNFKIRHIGHPHPRIVLFSAQHASSG